MNLRRCVFPDEAVKTGERLINVLTADVRRLMPLQAEINSLL
ncbi:MAG: hypothetical protein ABJB93_11635 [Gaiellales bacterium]